MFAGSKIELHNTMDRRRTTPPAASIDCKTLAFPGRLFAMASMKQGCYDVRRLKPVLKEFFFILVTLTASAPSWGTSYYPIRLDDPKAVYLTPDKFPVHADGVSDDTDAVQQAIDKAQETAGQGVVFIPQGRYRLTRTIYIWPGIRVIGYGTRRPMLVLAPNTPGYQDSNQEQLIVFF